MTVLVGLAINGIPKVGVVHYPFETNDPESRGITHFATQEHGLFFTQTNEDGTIEAPKYIEPFEEKEEFDESSEVLVTRSLRGMSERQEKHFHNLMPIKQKPIGGAGNKVYRIITGEVQGYVEPRTLLSFWDLCAPEVLLRAVGGCIYTIPNYADGENNYNLGGEFKTPLYDKNQPDGVKVLGFAAFRSVAM